MLIEPLHRFTVRLPDGTLCHLEPGTPVDLPDAQAQKLLERAKGRVRAMIHQQGGSPRSREMVIELAGHLSPVFWQSGTRILGPAVVSFVAKHRGEFFLRLESEGSFLWIHESLLRSWTAFEEQGKTICNCCGGSDYWTSRHGCTICRRCHPPASASLVKGGTL